MFLQKVEYIYMKFPSHFIALPIFSHCRGTSRSHSTAGTQPPSIPVALHVPISVRLPPPWISSLDFCWVIPTCENFQNWCCLVFISTLCCLNFGENVRQGYFMARSLSWRSIVTTGTALESFMEQVNWDDAIFFGSEPRDHSTGKGSEIQIGIESCRGYF